MEKCFDEIIGYEDIKKELCKILDCLKNPKKYEDFGIKLDRKLILSGEPGTGKTTMAKAMIGATGRICYTCRKSESDGAFLKTIVNIFKKAVQNQPSVIFFDDIDKFTDYQAYDQDSEEFVTIQSCMDEIGNADVFLIATANHYNKLPESLVRPGRFGRLIEVDIPTIEENEKIIQHYLKNKRVKNIDCKQIACILEGESCSMLETVVTDAAVLAAYQNKDFVEMDDMIEAYLNIKMGPLRNDTATNKEERRYLACHEAGHTLISELHRVGSVAIASIRRSHGDFGGFVSVCSQNIEDDWDDIIWKIKEALAGKAAAEVMTGCVDIGSKDDLRKAFELAEIIVDDYCSYGFDSWIHDRITEEIGARRNQKMTFLIEQQYIETKKLLVENRGFLEVLTDTLLKSNTIIGSDIKILREEYGV